MQVLPADGRVFRLDVEVFALDYACCDGFSDALAYEMFLVVFWLRGRVYTAEAGFDCLGYESGGLGFLPCRAV